MRTLITALAFLLVISANLAFGFGIPLAFKVFGLICVLSVIVIVALAGLGLLNLITSPGLHHKMSAR